MRGHALAESGEHQLDVLLQGLEHQLNFLDLANGFQVLGSVGERRWGGAGLCLCHKGCNFSDVLKFLVEHRKLVLGLELLGCQCL